MSDIDKLSEAIGRITSDIGHIRSSTDKISTKVDDMHEKNIINQQATKSAHKRLDKIEPHVETLNNHKNKQAGFIVAIAGVAGGVWAFIIKFFT